MTGHRETRAIRCSRIDDRGPSTAACQVDRCDCPTRLLDGTAWAYDRRLGWHDPAEHPNWTPSLWPLDTPL